jgi:hypothetical protein
MATAAPARKPAPPAPSKPAGSAAKPAPAATARAVAVRPTHAVALPADLQAELAGHAKEAAAKERPSVSKLSIKSGILAYQGNPVPGNAMDVIILGSSHRNVFYAEAYDPDNIVNPNCFAFSEDGEGMTPHENVTEPVHDTCLGCPNNEWGSAPQRGNKPSRGKACKQTRRLVLLPANILEEDDPVEAIKKAELAILDVPVTSVKNWANMVNSLAATINMPVWAVTTNVEVTPHMRNQMEIKFTPMAPAGGEAVIRALMARRDDALRIALQPYEGTGGEADPGAEEKAPATPNKFAAKKAPAKK